MRMTFAGCSTRSVTCRSSSASVSSPSSTPALCDGRAAPVTAMPFGPITTIRGSRSSGLLALGSFVGCSVMRSSLTRVESGSADGQQHLADAPAALDLLVRTCCVGQWEAGVHQRPDLAGSHQRPHLVDDRRADRGLL